MVERSAHNGIVIGSSPVAATKILQIGIYKGKPLLYFTYMNQLEFLWKQL